MPSDFVPDPGFAGFVCVPVPKAGVKACAWWKCGVEFVPLRKSHLYCSQSCGHAKYKASPKGRATTRKILARPERKVAIREYEARPERKAAGRVRRRVYSASEKGKAAAKKCRSRPEFKAAHREYVSRYRTTPNGIVAVRTANTKQRAKKNIEKLLIETRHHLEVMLNEQA